MKQGYRLPDSGVVGLSSRASVLCAARDPGEPREASRSLRRINRASGSLPYSPAPPLPPPEPPHSHPHLHRIQPGIRVRQPRIRDMQIPQLHAPVIFRPQHMRPQRRRGRKIHRIRISRDTVIAEQRPSTQLEIRREPPAPLKIPLQSQRIESHPISRIRRLKNQVRRHRIQRILKSPPQKSRQMRPRNHPPITQSRIKDSRPRSPTRHRVPTPSPNLHLMPALFRTRIGLSKARTRGRDHKREA